MTHEVTPELMQQIADQCRAVSKLAESLATIHGDYETTIRNGGLTKIAGIVGPRSASFMEQLGDWLNGMDAATEDDDWMAPIFEKAHELWPTP